MGKIYTKGGDKGMTSLYGGTRVRKSCARVGAYGAVDEANAAIGLAAVYIGVSELEDLLRLCQEKLFLVSAELASDERGKRMLKETITGRDAELLERSIDVFAEKLAPNTKFTIPGQTVRSAYLHMARTLTRRAERAILAIGAEARVNPDIVIFMNRLSDLLFILSRAVDELDIFKDKDER